MKQSNYRDGAPELTKSVLKFLNAKKYKWNSEKREDELKAN